MREKIADEMALIKLYSVPHSFPRGTRLDGELVAVESTWLGAEYSAGTLSTSFRRCHWERGRELIQCQRHRRARTTLSYQYLSKRSCRKGVKMRWLRYWVAVLTIRNMRWILTNCSYGDFFTNYARAKKDIGHSE
jgi:hypothetical protein